MRRFLVLAALALMFAAPAAADDVPVQLLVRGGALDLRVRAVGDGVATVEVRDARGSGAGWSLLMRGSATVTTVRARCAAGSTCTLPRTHVSYPLATRPAKPTAVFSARPGTGMGTVVLRLSYDGAARPSFSVG